MIGLEQRERAILHFNIADFAVAVARVCDSSLRHRPLLIAPLQAARAVVHDMSEEAYRDGVRKGMPLRRATRICPKALVLPPSFDLCRRAMAAFAAELRPYSPLVEAGDIDGHFYIDVTGTHRLHGPAPDIGWRVRRQVRHRLGINPIWTLGSGKLVAKVASRLVKPLGEYIVTPGEEAAFLAPLPMHLLPGLSDRERHMLADFQLTSIGALAELSLGQLQGLFGSRSGFLHEVSRGIDASRVAGPEAVVETIDSRHRFLEESNDRRVVEAVVTTLAGEVGHQLRRRGQVARRVALELEYGDGGKVLRQVSCRRGAAGDVHLHTLALAVLARAWTRRTRLRGCRLICDRLQRRSPQLGLFDGMLPSEEPGARVQAAIDGLRRRFGEGIIGLGRRYPSAGDGS
jgi:DNA polymerase IV